MTWIFRVFWGAGIIPLREVRMYMYRDSRVPAEMHFHCEVPRTQLHMRHLKKNILERSLDYSIKRIVALRLN